MGLHKEIQSNEESLSKVKKEQKEKPKKMKKRVKKIKEENEEKGAESEYEWITDEEAVDEEDDEDQKVDGDDSEDDEDDEDEDARIKAKNEALNAKLTALQEQKESSEQMQNRLSVLTSSLDNIRSQPLIVDLTKKRQRNDDLSQQLIGRQMRLRDIRQKYQKMMANIKDERQQKQQSEMGDTTKSEYLEEFQDLNPTQIASLEKMGCVLGQIEIPNSSLKSLGYDKTQRVMLPSQQFNSLQTSFLF